MSKNLFFGSRGKEGADRPPPAFILPGLLALALAFAWARGYSADKIREKDLSPQYQEWLKVVTYIIRPEEKDVFLRLANDRERDLFIQTFWKMRDPTPGTPQNEFQEEHMRRFIHANKRYGRNTPREGWMTDMGRIYIILGEPTSVEVFEVSGIYPAEVWTYYGDQTKGLPTQFNLVFFQRHGAGEYKLYNPTSDGPAALIIDKQGLDLTNSRQLYEKLLKLAPTLAGPAVSLIPGRYPYNYQPSPQNNIILANIFEAPKKAVNARYATHFLNYRGVVSTEYLTNFVESQTDLAVLQDPVLGIHLVHFSISPSRVSVAYYEPKDQYYCSYQMDVNVRKGERTILQYSKDFPFYFDPDNVELIQSKGIAIQDSFPLAEGDFEINILVRNLVGKEFSVFEGEVAVPTKSVDPGIEGLVVGYKLQEYPGHLHVPFKALDKQLLVDPSGTLSPTEDVSFFFTVVNTSRQLWEEGWVEVLVKGLQAKNPAEKSFKMELKDHPFHSLLGIHHSIPAGDLPPDYYELILTLKDGGGNMLDEETSRFIVSPSEGVPHPVTLSKSFPLSNYYLFLYSLAHQYVQLGRTEEAESFYEKARTLRPGYAPGIVAYARLLLSEKKFQESLELIETLKEDATQKFDYFVIRGRALMGMEKYFAAVEDFLRANEIYNSDVRLLNSLGFCFYKIGEKERALEVLRSSLRLNPEQEEVKNLIKEIEKQLDGSGRRAARFTGGATFLGSLLQGMGGDRQGPGDLISSARRYT